MLNIIIVFLILVLLMLVAFIWCYINYEDVTKQRAYDQVANKIKEIRENKMKEKIYKQKSFELEKYNFDIIEGYFLIFDKVNKRHLILDVDNIINLKKEFSGKKHIVDGYDYVWDNYGIKIEYLEDDGKKEEIFWLNSDMQNIFNVVDNISNSLILDSLIYNVLKIKDVA